GDNLSLPERASVRTPMQWTDEKHAGFSSARPDQLIKPVIAGGDYGYERINVAAQQRDPQSLFCWLDRLILVRKECPVFGRGRLTLLETPVPSVLLHRCEWRGSAVLAVHNLADERAAVRIDLKTQGGEYLMELLGDHPYQRIERSGEIEMQEYGY